MNGWLLYSPVGVERNRWFVDRLIAEAKARGISLQLKLVPEVGVPTAEFFSELRSCPPDFAVVRVIRPDLSEILEEAGVRCVNNALTSRVANDKWRTFQLAQTLALPVIGTYRFTWPKLPECGFPCVAKSLDGHGGREVTFVDNAVALADFVAGCGKHDFIAQPMCSDPGRDIRVYVLGGKIVSAVMRTSEIDFRSNYSLGGEVKMIGPSCCQREIVHKLYERLKFDFVGVDFIFHEGQWILNEIEDVVGCRMLYAVSRLDAVKSLVDMMYDSMASNAV